MRRDIDDDAWRTAFLNEINYYAGLVPGRSVSSIFFGGGTPSLMKPQTVEGVINAIGKAWGLEKDCEITLEANPTSVESGKFSAFRHAGVNRVSVGVQSFNDEALKFLGRKHSAAEARRAIEIAQQNFDRFSFDLIYARPGQTVKEWRAELKEALNCENGHLSLYQLTIEQGTPFYMQARRGDFTMPENDLAGEMYELTQDVMGAAGLPAYEVSNHARPGHESVHNRIYWRYEDYAGIGPGAHGRLTFQEGGRKYATRGHRAPEIWLERALKQGHGAHPHEELGRQQEALEALMMGLRLRDGLPEQHIKGARAYLDAGKLRALEEEGLMIANDNTICATPPGMQRLNGMLAYLLDS